MRPGYFGGSPDQVQITAGRRIKLDFPPEDRNRAFNRVDTMHPMADSRGVSVARIVLAWLLHSPQVTNVIVGTKRPEQRTDNLAAKQFSHTPAFPGRS